MCCIEVMHAYIVCFAYMLHVAASSHTIASSCEGSLNTLEAPAADMAARAQFGCWVQLTVVCHEHVSAHQHMRLQLIVVCLRIAWLCVQVLVHQSHLRSGALDKIQAALQEAGVQVGGV